MNDQHSPGMFIRTERRPSPGAGTGLWTRDAVARGTIVTFYAEGGRPITEDEYVEGLRRGDPLITRTGTRWAGRWFNFGQSPGLFDCEFINHSFEPNLLAFCGMFIARVDIAADSELTVDYRHLLDPTDVGVWIDHASGKPVKGFTARESMLIGLEEMKRIVEATW